MRIYGAHFRYLEGEPVDLDDESAERVRSGRQVGGPGRAAAMFP